MVDAGVVLIVIAARAGVGAEIIDVGERESGGVGETPVIRQNFRRGIETGQRNDVVGELRAGDLAVRADCVGLRIVNRDQRSIGAASVGKVADALLGGGYGHQERNAIAQAKSFPGEEEERLVLLDGTAKVGSVLVLRERRDRLAG